MFDDSASVGNVLARFDALVDDLIAIELSTCSRDELLALTQGVEAQRRRLSAVDHRLIAELESRGVAQELCAGSTTALLSMLLRLGRRDAASRVTAASEFGPRRNVTGQVLEPLRPHVAAAQSSGVLSDQHARVIRKAITVLPQQVQFEHADAVERRLVEQAAVLDPDQLNRLARRIVDMFDPDGTLTDDADHERRRGLTLTQERDGMARLTGSLTPACAAVWQPVLDALSQPAPAGDDGIADLRSGPERRHDALLDAGKRLLRTGDLPESGGTPVSVAVTIDLEELEARSGLVTTAHGGTLSVAELLRLAAEAELMPVVLGGADGVLAYGRNRRVASPGQRRALAARDGGCSFPGCDRPPLWCEAHHVIDWLHGGCTDLENLCLLCGFHHREFERAGWRCRIVDGVPYWIPPAWLDPEQTPRRNTMHRPAQLVPI